MVVTRAPNPSNVLPEAGLTEVLFQAAASNPLITLLVAATIICFAWWSSCQVLIRRKHYDVMKSPEAAKAMTELAKIENAHKRAMAKLKKKS